MLSSLGRCALRAFEGLSISATTSSAFQLQQRTFTRSAALLKSIRDEQRAGTKVSPAQQDAFDGTAGSELTVPVNLKGAESRLPTAETYKELFNGIPFSDLPMVYIKATKNNTLVQAVDPKTRSVIMYTSCRLEGFKNARKKTNIAGQTTGVAAGQRLVRRGIRTVRVQVKGIGPGRMTAVKGLTVAGVQVVAITDYTPLKELGPRPRKIRRI
ncbi:unnamed protein product, partial [Mesorhabditis belari]|uniref:Mitochondrial ribosomal protein S11 n=1 Tax=Mesorhabditis belari TaxID=2138241 RepID=A0AAF3FID3_9BILA